MNAPKARGWTEAGHADRWLKQEGNRLAIVTLIGDGIAASWGFAVWSEGFCIGGRCNWTWSAEDACNRADEWLAKHAETETA
jgi:hypothetical protein